MILPIIEKHQLDEKKNMEKERGWDDILNESEREWSPW